MALKKDSRKRRSDRLMFMIPLRVSGTTETGEPFECRGHAVAVNRFGAHIRLERPMPVSHKVLLTNLENNLRGEFRIVRTLERSRAGRTDFGVEALGNYPTFWGIAFAARPRKQGESRGLLECLQCHSATLHPLMLDEIEVLESGGTVKKPCTYCGSKTEWKFAMQGARPDVQKAGPASSGEGGAAEGAPRGRPTVFMQRPVSILSASGEVETVLTENLSSNEIRCASKKSYEVDQIVKLEWESSGTGRRIRIQGRIRRRQSIAGSPRVFYSIRYEGPPAFLPPAQIKSARKLYASMAGLVAAASALLAVNVQGLVFDLTIPSGSTARLVADLGAVLLLVSLAYKAWKIILAREPENRQTFRKRHRVVAFLAAAVFLGSLGVGVVDGVARNNDRRQTLKVLHDLAIAHILESNIDAAENRVTHSPSDYADACATLALLASEWQRHIDTLSADVQVVDRAHIWHDAKSREERKGLEEILALDHQKLRLVQQQIALKDEAQSIAPNNRTAFWQTRFPPLRQKIRDLDREKSQVVKTLSETK